MSVERIQIIETTPWTGEHLHRYAEACKYVNEGDISLDLACGSGYGTNIISQKSKNNVFGGDIDQLTIEFCQIDWATNEKLCFEIMDGTQLRFEDEFFDKIVSIETIEHLVAYHQMLAEFSRVLKKSGIAIISTPNIKVSSPNGVVVNPYHTQEFTYDELLEILNKHFTEVKIYGQMYTRYFNINKKIKKAVESILLCRGIRKLPYTLRNKVFKSLFNTELYPTSDNYQLFAERDFIEANCHVLFAVCKK